MIGLSIIFFSAIIILFTGIQKPEKKSKNLTVFSLLVAALFSLFENLEVINTQTLFAWVPSSMLDFNNFRLSMVALVLFLSAIIIGLMPSSEKKGSDLLGLTLFALCGGIIMLGSNHLVMLFLGIEILSIPLYVLAGSDKKNLFANEAAIKYFLMGAFSTAIFLLGCAFIYGGTGTLIFGEMQLKVGFAAHFGEFPILIKLGVILMSVGMLFKISAVPFHFWSPDVYEGSPNRVTSFMAIIVKICGFVAFAQLMSNFEPMHSWYIKWLIPISGITILLGNIAGMVQKSVKRTLAYSSIAHAGYLILFLLIPYAENAQILFVYSLSYGLSTSVMFYLIDKYSKADNFDFTIFKGIFNSNKLDAMALILAVLSLAGIPATIGFTAKYVLFSKAFEYNQWAVVIGLVGSAISIVYYFKPFKYAFVNENLLTNRESSLFTNILLVLAMLSIVIFGLIPGIIL